MTNGTRRGRGVSVMPRLLFTPRKDPVPIAQEAGWAPGLVLTGAENLAPTRIRSPDRPARSQSLYRLSYPGPTRHENHYQMIAIMTAYICDKRQKPKNAVKFAYLLIQSQELSHTVSIIWWLNKTVSTQYLFWKRCVLQICVLLRVHQDRL